MYSDAWMLSYIIRVNLDICWSWSSGTVSSVKNDLTKILDCWNELGIALVLPSLGPLPVEDRVGFCLAIAHLRYSQRSGKNKDSHLQYNTACKL